MLDQKIKLIRERMVKEEISMLVLSPGPHMAWLFGFYPLPDERPCFSCLSLNNLSFLDSGSGRRIHPSDPKFSQNADFS